MRQATTDTLKGASSGGVVVSPKKRGRRVSRDHLTARRSFFAVAKFFLFLALLLAACMTLTYIIKLRWGLPV